MYHGVVRPDIALFMRSYLSDCRHLQGRFTMQRTANVSAVVLILKADFSIN